MLVFIQRKQFYILSERRHFPHSCLQLQPVKTFANKSDRSLRHSRYFKLSLLCTSRNMVVYSFHLMSAGFDRSTFISPFPGILCVENVPGTFLGVLSSGRLFPEAVWRATGMTGNLGGLTIHLPWMCHGFVFDLTLCIHVCIFVFLIWSSNLWKTCLFFNTYILFFFYKKCFSDTLLTRCFWKAVRVKWVMWSTSLNLQ